MKLPSNSDEAANCIDQTLLRPELPESTYKQWLIDNARRKFKTLFVPPYYVPLASMHCIETETRVGSVVWFPMGFMVRHTKIQALKDLIDRGAEEIDFVVNISFLKSGNDAEFKGELKDLRAYADSRKTVRDEPVILKGIIECCYLTEAEKRWAVEHLANAGIDFVKTSTGTASGGATVNDIVLIKSSSQRRIAIKASGGIRTKEDLEKMLKAGATRIGTSYGAHIIAEYISIPEF
ncbi:deoxyribose-phosphate aldolase [bacterium]|nr:deoxyribose-phosphate aldolase [bacterium]